MVRNELYIIQYDYQKYSYTVLIIVEFIHLLNTSLIPIERRTARNFSFARIKM